MADLPIIRCYPWKRPISGPCTDDFKKFNKITKHSEIFWKWFDGFNPSTDRKCNIGGKLHKEIGEKFGYKLYEIYEKLIDMPIDNPILKKNQLIIEYNKSVDEVMKKLDKLKWDEYVEFDGKKYGIKFMINNQHMENDCNGNITGTIHFNGKDYCPQYLCSKCGDITEKCIKYKMMEITFLAKERDTYRIS